MKKILFILHLPPPVHGSSTVGQYIYESKIINNAFECRFINLSTSRLINEIGKKPIQKIGRYFSILYQVFKQLICFKPQLCYLAITAKGYAFYKDALIALMAKTFKVPLVYHFHNKGVSTWQTKRLNNILYHIVFKNSYAILLSKHLYPDVQKYFSDDKVFYCPNGIPDTTVKRTKDLDSIDKGVRILFLSNLIEAKGVFVLLEACKILKNKKIQFYCSFAGDEGDITSRIFNKVMKDLDLTDVVLYVGRKYGKEKEEAFAKADIFAFPTNYHNECFPLVLLEAMQYALPTVSTFEGGIPDIIEENKTGFLVPQKDAKALAEKLEILIKSPELRQQMGNAGRKKYEKEFTLNAFEERLKGILKEIVNE
jgi:glycosyltransferase involved in cell wall biosynthesis